MTEQEIVQFPAGTIGPMVEEMAAAWNRDITKTFFAGIDLAAGDDLSFVWTMPGTVVRTRLPETSWRSLHEQEWFEPRPEPHAAAEAKAEQLLRDWLSPQQRESYDKDRHFTVTGSRTGKRYRINHGRAYNISELDADGAEVCDWCFVPEGGLAVGDCMLAQKIALETDELAALKVANRREVGAINIWHAGEINLSNWRELVRVATIDMRPGAGNYAAVPTS